MGENFIITDFKNWNSLSPAERIHFNIWIKYKKIFIKISETKKFHVQMISEPSRVVQVHYCPHGPDSLSYIQK